MSWSQTFLGPRLNQLVLWWYLLKSSKVHTPRGFDNYQLYIYMNSSILQTLFLRLSFCRVAHCRLLGKEQISTFLIQLYILWYSFWDFPIVNFPRVYFVQYKFNCRVYISPPFCEDIFHRKLSYFKVLGRYFPYFTLEIKHKVETNQNVLGARFRGKY